MSSATNPPGNGGGNGDRSSRDRWKARLRPAHKKPPEPERDFLDTARLGDATKWINGGFAALVAILTFFQIRDGILDRLLRADPTAALWVFILIGIGVVSSLFAGAIGPHDGRTGEVGTRPRASQVVTGRRVTWRRRTGRDATRWEVRTPVPAVIAAVLGLGLITALVLENLPDPEDSGLTSLLAGFLLAILLALGFFAREATIATAAAVIVVGAAATSMGLYSAAKLSVLAKSFDAGSGITASLETADSGDRLEIDAVADQREDKDLFVSVVAGTVATPHLDPREVMLQRARLTADAAGNIDTSVSVPLHAETWDYISIRACDKETCSSEDEVVRLNGEREPATLPRVTGSLSPGEDGAGVDVLLSAADLPIDWTVTGYVYRTGPEASEVLLAQGSVSRDAEGAAEWKPFHLTPGQGDRLVLRYDFCVPEPNGPCEHTDAREAAVLAIASVDP